MDILGKTYLTKGTMSVKDLMWEHFQVRLRNSKETSMVGVNRKLGRVVDPEVKEVMGQ